MLVIDKDVPIPTRGSRFPWHEMDVGDSVLIPPERMNSARTSMHYAKHNHGMRFTTRSEGTGMRVWRTA